MKKVFLYASDSVTPDNTASENAEIAAVDREKTLLARIDNKPGKETEVNEEVFFSAENTTYYGKNIHESSDPAFLSALFEWDFGDGYCLKYGAPELDYQDSAVAVTHYYMKPGTFTVTLHVSVYAGYPGNVPEGEPLAEATETTEITVTGDEPLSEFELLHAPIHSRIAQPVIVLLPQKVTEAKGTRLTVTLKGAKGTDLLLFDKTGLAAKEKFLLRAGKLKADTYRLTASLFDEKGVLLCDGVRKGIWTETFQKDFDGMPRVGIDENNSLCVDGEPFFPITPFVLNRAPYPQWKNCVNTMYGVGYDAEGPNTVGVFTDYLDKTAENNYKMIGPTRGIYVKTRSSNKDCEAMREFIRTAKDRDNFLLYEWQDEPNMGTLAQRVPPPALAAWKYIVGEHDRQHPVLINYYAFNWFFNYYKNKTFIEHDAVGSIRYNARHSFACDMFTSDVYPINFRRDIRLLNYPRGPVDLWLQNMETTAENFFHLLPQGVFVEVTHIQKKRNADGGFRVPTVTGSQVLMECWLAVVHGAKMINFFQHFQDDLIQYDAMAEFKRAIDTYGKILLGAGDVAQITSSSRVRANRVDTLTRLDGANIYLFAVRLTEPEPIEGETVSALPENIEPETVETTFTVPQTQTGCVEVLNETGTVLRSMTLCDGQFTDTFARDAYHIYRISPLPDAK